MRIDTTGHSCDFSFHFYVLLSTFIKLVYPNSFVDQQWHGAPRACCFFGYHPTNIKLSTLGVLRELFFDSILLLVTNELLLNQNVQWVILTKIIFFGNAWVSWSHPLIAKSLFLLDWELDLHEPVKMVFMVKLG